MTASHFVRLLAMFALLLMPLAMLGQGHAVAAAPHHRVASRAPGHCADMDGKPDEKQRNDSSAAECLMACAALPAGETSLAVDQIVLRATLVSALLPITLGFAPEAETPPPRIA